VFRSTRSPRLRQFLSAGTHGWFDVPPYCSMRGFHAL